MRTTGQQSRAVRWVVAAWAVTNRVMSIRKATP
jgi:hypothetical protein